MHYYSIFNEKTVNFMICLNKTGLRGEDNELKVHIRFSSVLLSLFLNESC